MNTIGQNGYGQDDQGAIAGQEKIRRLVHSTQDIDDAGGASVPPQVTVKRVENLFHKRSYSVAVEKVVVPPSKELVQSTENDHNNSELTINTEHIEKRMEEKRKAYLDEFDKLLGLQSRSANPINRIMSTFLGPLMRVLRIPVFIFRICFNAYTWRDPYLSFWLFCSMCVTLLVLMAFPWRLFFLVATIGCVGPQNIILRRYLEKRASRKADEASEKEQVEIDNCDMASTHSAHAETSSLTSNTKRLTSVTESDNASVRSNEPRRGFFGRRKRNNKNQHSAEPSEFFSCERPPFCGDYGSSTNRKVAQPRSVVIPYGKLRKERFFDWPPDPTVSRATPLEIDAWEPVVPEEMMSQTVEPQIQRRTSLGSEPWAENAPYDIRKRRGSL